MDYWTYFAGEAERGRSPLYAELARIVGNQDHLKALAGKVRKGQPPANMLFGAVHYLLLRGTDHPLAEYYPSVRSDGRPLGSLAQMFEDFCRRHEAALVPLISGRVTNTNEVRRSTALYPAFDHVAQFCEAQLHLIEIGPSAGFNLLWDRYSYTYRCPDGAAIARAPGPGFAALQLTSALKGADVPALQERMPAVASRMGIELNPVNLTLEEDRDWLRALVWPELTDRHVNLALAIKAVQAAPPRIWPGDALELLPRALAQEFPAKAPVTIFHSHVTYQFSDAMRAQLENTLVAASHEREIYRISIEFDRGPYVIQFINYTAGHRIVQILGHCHPHGEWIDWEAGPL